MPLLLGGVLLVLFALLSLSASQGALGRKRAENTILGGLLVGAVVFVLARAGLPWLGLGLALLWGAAKRFGSNNRGASPAQPQSSRNGATPRAVTDGMTREEAYAVLGLPPDASNERVLAEYRRLMKKVHPDQGGTTYLAARLNQAKAILLGD